MEYERRNPRNMNFEYIVPSSSWTESTDYHCLLIDLPGFKQEELRIRDDNYGHLIVSGETQASDDKIIHFEQSYKVPESGDINETSAILDDDVFYVSIPKKVIPEKEVHQFQNSNSVQGKDKVQNNVSDGLENVNNDSNNEGTSQEEEDDEDEEEEDDEDEEEESSDHTTSADELSESSLMEKIKKNKSSLLIAIIAFSLGVFVSHRYQSAAKVERSQ